MHHQKRTKMETDNMDTSFGFLQGLSADQGIATFVDVTSENAAGTQTFLKITPAGGTNGNTILVPLQVMSSLPYTPKANEVQVRTPKQAIKNGTQFDLPTSTVSDPPVTPMTTLVFFDLETTGLPHLMGARNVHITEISMIAIDREDFKNCPNPTLKGVRVIQKLSMCIKPRVSISSGSAKITGLNDQNVCRQQSFDKEAAQAILSFLARLPQPFCLIAHNGNTFDYPLLKAEFNRLNIQLPENILTADTLIGFRTIGLDGPSPAAENKTPTSRGAKGKHTSYSLENIHRHYFNRKPQDGHSSEGDCMTLAKVCHKAKDQMLSWIDKNNKTFVAVSPMW